MEQRSYNTDLTDQQWEIVKKYIPIHQGRGRKAQDSKPLIINAILYLVHIS